MHTYPFCCHVAPQQRSIDYQAVHAPVVRVSPASDLDEQAELAAVIEEECAFSAEGEWAQWEWSHGHEIS